MKQKKVGNLNKVIAGTYHVIDSTPVDPWGVLMAVMAGFYKSAKLIFMIMFCGGAVAVLEKSGSINAAFGRLASNKAQRPCPGSSDHGVYVCGAQQVCLPIRLSLWSPLGSFSQPALDTTRLLASCLFTWALTPALM